MLGDILPNGNWGEGSSWLTGQTALWKKDRCQYCRRWNEISSVTWFSGFLPDTIRHSKLGLGEWGRHVTLAPAQSKKLCDLVQSIPLGHQPLIQEHRPFSEMQPATRVSIFRAKLKTVSFCGTRGWVKVSVLRKAYWTVRVCWHLTYWQVLLHGASVLWYHIWSFKERGLCQYSLVSWWLRGHVSTTSRI